MTIFLYVQFGYSLKRNEYMLEPTYITVIMIRIGNCLDTGYLSETQYQFLYDQIWFERSND